MLVYFIKFNNKKNSEHMTGIPRFGKNFRERVLIEPILINQGFEGFC